jgi:hypothetical protein
VTLFVCKKPKKEVFGIGFVRKFCPLAFDCFEFVSSNRASSGTIITWKSSRFSGHVISHNEYAMSVEFSSTFSGAVWILTNIYAPCTT